MPQVLHHDEEARPVAAEVGQALLDLADRTQDRELVEKEEDSLPPRPAPGGVALQDGPGQLRDHDPQVGPEPIPLVRLEAEVERDGRTFVTSGHLSETEVRG